MPRRPTKIDYGEMYESFLDRKTGRTRLLFVRKIPLVSSKNFRLPKRK